MKIGMIDYDLNEWHAENYPEFFRKYSHRNVEVTCVYAMIDGKSRTKQQWATEYGVKLCTTIEDIIDICDGLIILSPDNPEFHPILSEQALASGKRVFIDKTFSTNYVAAKAMFERANTYNTKCYSASALCFAEEYKAIIGKADALSSVGVGTYCNYAIHQIDPLLTIMQDKANCVWTDESENVFHILFENGSKSDFRMNQTSYSMLVTAGKKQFNLTVTSNFWENCIHEMSRFFVTGELPVPHSQTLEAMAIREAGIKAMKTPGEKIFLQDIRK